MLSEKEFERELLILDRQIGNLMAIQEHLNKMIDTVPFKEKYAWELLNKEFRKVSNKTRLLFNVQENIQKMIDYKITI